jgi:PBSX family phage terminase large subunit
LQIQLTKPQHDFLTDDRETVLFAAGIGSGKSFVGSHWSMNMLTAEPKAKGFIGANTYNQLQNATLATFFGVLDEFRVPYSYNQKTNIIKAAGRLIYAYSLDNYDAIRGIEVGWAWLDETRDTKKAAFHVVQGRMRDKNASKRRMRLTSSPSGYNWLYDDFASANKKAGYGLIHGTTMDNVFLPDGYAESLKKSYDQKAYAQEVLGEFVNLNQGAIYYAFDRQRNVKPQVRVANFPVRVAMDFNINPMTAVAFQDYDNKLHVLKEYWLMSSNTDQLGQVIIEDFGRGTEVVPDSTGKALKTASRGLSDHQILRNMGLVVLYNRNPSRVDRYNCVNNLFEKERCEIDPTCVNLIRDLEKTSYDEGTNQPDTSTDKTLTHVSDALGYAGWYCYPIIKPSSGVSMVPR